MTKDSEELVLFINEYYKRFFQYLDHLAVGRENEQEAKDFFADNNLIAVSDAIRSLEGKVDASVSRLVGAGEKVISCSFQNGEFDIERFRKGLEEHKDELVNAIEGLRHVDQELMGRLEAFIDDGYLKTTLTGIQNDFVLPFSFDIWEMAEKINRLGNVYSFEAYQKKLKNSYKKKLFYKICRELSCI